MTPHPIHRFEPCTECATADEKRNFCALCYPEGCPNCARNKRDTLPAPPPEPTEPLNDRPEHPFHAHLETCTQCREHPFDLCDDGAALLGDSAVLSFTVPPVPPATPPRASWGSK